MSSSGEKPAGSGPTDGFDLLIALAAKYDVDPAELLERLSGSDVLAKICRDVLGLPGSQRRRGKKPNEDRNWRLFQFVARYRLMHDASLAEAIRQWVAENGGDNENGTAESNVLRLYQRQPKEWFALDALRLLFMDQPPGRT